MANARPARDIKKRENKFTVTAIGPNRNMRRLIAGRIDNGPVGRDRP
jgi:hypothetical protein